MARTKRSAAPVILQKQEVDSFEAKQLLSVLNAGSLGGVVDEAVLTIEDGVGLIAAVDKTSCVFAFSQGNIGNIKNSKIGLKEMGFLVKAIEAASAQTINFIIEDGKWFKINLPQAGEIKILLTPPDMIPTAISDYNTPIDKMKAAVTHTVELNKEAVDKFLYFQDLVKNNTTCISVKDGALFIGSGKYETRTFQVQMGAIKGADLQIVVFGDFLRAIFNALDWSDGGLGVPTISLGVGAPVLIEQNPDRFWSLSPSTESGQ